MLLDGARQVGKTYLIEALFGQSHFTAIHKLDFLSEPSLSVLFEESLEPATILNNIEIRKSKAPNRAVLKADRRICLECRHDFNTPLCHSELVSESPKDGNNPEEILKQVQDDTLVCVLRSFLGHERSD